MARASCSKRRTRSGSAANASGRTLIATSRPRRVSRARYTSPMPPVPISETISYGPISEPSASGMIEDGPIIFRATTAHPRPATCWVSVKCSRSHPRRRSPPWQEPFVTARSVRLQADPRSHAGRLSAYRPADADSARRESSHRSCSSAPAASRRDSTDSHRGMHHRCSLDRHRSRGTNSRREIALRDFRTRALACSDDAATRSAHRRDLRARVRPAKSDAIVNSRGDCARALQSLHAARCATDVLIKRALSTC